MPGCPILRPGLFIWLWAVRGQRWGQYSMLKYKGFLIEPFETEPGRKITRPDHRKIKTFPDGQEHDFIRTGGAETFSAEAAIKVAMRLIDGGGMS